MDSKTDKVISSKTAKQGQEAPLKKKVVVEDHKRKTESKKINEEKLKKIEEEIVTEKPKIDEERDKLPPAKTDAIKEPSPRGDEGPKKEDSSGDQSPPSKPKEESAAELDLEGLYLEVESLAEEILKEEPENEMVNRLAPHLESVLKSLENGKLSGLKDSLLHIKTILLDLKERLAESKKVGPETHSLVSLSSHNQTYMCKAP